jgi:hypothetical protein|tara:strand:+ start:33 stop:407 length:375 start_codon:yes stop_codon:yes gene_type:complete
MKITKARLKAIILEELESVMNEEDEEEVTTEGADDDEKIEEIGLGGMGMPGGRHGSHRERPAYQRATVGGRVAGRGEGEATPVLDAASEALGMSPSEMMLALAQEMGVKVAGNEEAPLPAPEGE